MRRVGQPHVVPAEVLLPARVGGGHHVAGVGGEVEERMLENLARVVARGELRHGVMHVLILLVLQLQRHDGQAVEEEDEINLLVRLAEVEMRAEGDAVLGVLLGGGARGGARLGIEEPELQPAHLQAVAEQHPERRVLQFLAQRLEHLVPRVRAVIVLQLLERVGLRGLEKGPELIFGDEMLGVRDVGLFEHAILVLADEVIRDVLLKRQLRGFLVLAMRLNLVQVRLGDPPLAGDAFVNQRLAVGSKRGDLGFDRLSRSLHSLRLAADQAARLAFSLESQVSVVGSVRMSPSVLVTQSLSVMLRQRLTAPASCPIGEASRCCMRKRSDADRIDMSGVECKRAELAFHVERTPFFRRRRWHRPLDAPVDIQQNVATASVGYWPSRREVSGEIVRDHRQGQKPVEMDVVDGRSTQAISSSCLKLSRVRFTRLRGCDPAVPGSFECDSMPESFRPAKL